MKVQVLSVQSAIAPNTHEVILSVGTDTQKFIFTTEVDGETRQRARSILEQLPEAVLDEAVSFLESLYVKSDRVE